jgi:uncharacterized protein
MPAPGADETPPDCRRCGACCFSASPRFVRVTGDDWTRLGREAARLAQFVGNRAFMRMHGGHCAALEIGRTAEGGQDFFCTIYDRRPDVCRTLERGSPECAGEITLKFVPIRSA